MIDMPSTGVQSLRPHAFQNAPTVLSTRLNGVSWMLGVLSAPKAGSLGYLWLTKVETQQVDEHRSGSSSYSAEKGNTQLVCEQVSDPGHAPKQQRYHKHPR